MKGIGLLLVLALSAGVAVGQLVAVGELGGQVKDETGAALPGASVTAVSRELGVSRTVSSDTTGRFRFSELQPGRYNVSVALSGFGTVTLTDNLVETNKKTDLAVTMKLSAQQAAVTVTGEVPIVDKTQSALETRQRAKEFEKMPQGRNYQSLFLNAPGVNLPPGANPNPNVHGALGSNNLWLYDGVDTTDPTTGTFGSNLNFEAIQEVSVITSGVSAEYGRAAGGVINVITKSGTNTFAGSTKVIMTNDNWNTQNSTINPLCSVVSGAVSCPNTSLARVKYDHVNPRYAVTLGGPFWKDHVWFFGAYESANNTTAQRTTAVSGESYQQSTRDRFWDAKLTAQLTPSVTLSARGVSSPTSGIIRSDYGNPAEIPALTGQDQTGQVYAGFLTGVFGSNLTAEIQGNWNGPSNSASKHYIDVYPIVAGAPHFSLADGFYYNGAFFDGYVNRPRQGVLGAATYYTDIAGNSHSFKAGVDYQHLNSTSQFGYPNNQLFIDNSFDYKTRTFSPNSRRDYAPAVPSTSIGNIIAVYARDKFEVGKHLFFELGLRYEHQKSNDDINRITVNQGTVSPRISGSYDISGTGKSLIVGTYGRFYQFVLQTFSDSFGQNVQRGTYDAFNYNNTTKQYEFAGHVSLAAGNVIVNDNIKPTYNDEGTLGIRQQIGNTMGVTLTGIYRKWGNFIDDTPVYNADGSQTTTYVNYAGANRKFYGVELVFDKRFSAHWNANASYSWGRTKGNQLADTASALGDYANSNCRTTVDTTIGNNGVLPCSTVTDGPNKYGEASFSTTNNVKFGGAYVHSLGPANLALGLGGQLVDGIRFQKQRALTVLLPNTTTNTSTTETYFYEGRGAETTPTLYEIDASLEATFTLFRTLELGVKGEIFNVTDIQRQITVDQTTWCDNATAAPTSSCGLARINFGKATARGSYQAPRAYRLTALVRF